MGFDFEFVRPLEDCPDDYEPIDDDFPDCYRFTSHAMALSLQVMQDAGVIDNEQSVPSLPEWPPAGFDPQRAKNLERYLEEPDVLRSRLLPPEIPLFDAYVRAEECAQSNPGKVPAFKFQSNDGWFVTPDECRAIDNALRRAIEKNVEAVFDLLTADGSDRESAIECLRSWAEYNRLAANCGGYRVF